MKFVINLTMLLKNVILKQRPIGEKVPGLPGTFLLDIAVLASNDQLNII
jgi:hypothetical protein